ncbi:ABC transporter permease [Conexibacter woesei]|uniref:Transport permease protein n=1 Tax=Conexibacter woesei (strain DSM 14684 / CCUG 47730 / CIP 108061 / JCM 11494 / NBRC 100937 / ID131577) TaxID=469383 RepID=D3FBN0_CONWI|nr:ABC transporter permease [Conexibacter woesei]ADB49399.1 ABC-2 type transporter [Conexibacter woesei DSM 14684]
MSATLTHSWWLTVRQLRALWRQPWWIAISLAQPIIWLLLFGQLFRSIVELPGFGSDSYADFLTPGIVVMTAMFSGGWHGMGMLDDLDRGILDRFLTSPSSRVALIAGPLAQLAIVTAIQTLIIVGLGVVVGADFAGGVPGVLVLIVAAVLLGTAVGALSIGLALVTRRQETMIGAVQFVTLPLTFLSGAFMNLSLAPAWIESIARFNPVNWAVEAGREALTAEDVDWGMVGTRLGLLALLTVLCGWVATRAFRSYQRSV